MAYVAATPSATGKYTAGPVSLQFTLTTNKTAYAQGEPVYSTFTVTNTGQQTISDQLDLPYDFQVIQGSRVIYWLSRDPNLGFGACCTTVPPLASGQSFIYSTNPTQNDGWNQKDLQGNQVAPGQYTLVAWWVPASINGSDSSAYNVGQTATNPGSIPTLLGAKPVTFTIQ